MFAERAQEDAISIHAPTRGATIQQAINADTVADFNPRSYKRSDDRTTPVCVVKLDFNPRSYKRSDEKHCVASGHTEDISIHAPTRGATCLYHSLFLQLYLFQSTLLQEERRDNATSH